MGRNLATKLQDLLPDVLIEAQRCDDITAKKALERTAEELAYEHNFFTGKLRRKYDQDTDEVYRGMIRAKVFPVDALSILDVLECEVDGRARGVSVEREPGRVLVYCPRWKDAGEVEMVISYLPPMDEDVLDPEVLTVGRRVLVAGALADLFAMSNQPWANPERSQLWRSRFWESLASWKSREFRCGSGATVQAVNPLGYL